MCRYSKIAQSNALTFLELVIAISILTVAMLGFLEILNTALNTKYRANQEIIATSLGRSLMAEITAKNFADPQFPNNALGPDPTTSGDIETRHGTKNNSFDDVDDYNRYTESKGWPVSIGGLPMNGLAGMPDYSKFYRSVSVVFVNASMIQVSSPTGYKKIIVTTKGPYVSDIITTGIKTNVTQ
jgi:Tfp pilus assembly protein PilV